jgi:hypothetical protein
LHNVALANDCAWDKMRKSVWIEELNQHEAHMTYPIQHDLPSKKIALELKNTGKYLSEYRSNGMNTVDTSYKKQHPQIYIRPKLANVEFSPSSYPYKVIGSGKVEIILELDIYDTFTWNIINTVQYKVLDRVFFSLGGISQATLHDRVQGAILNDVEKIKTSVETALDCIPFASLIEVNHHGEFYLHGGGQNGVTPGMKMTVFQVLDETSTPKQIRKITDAVVKDVYPWSSQLKITNSTLVSSGRYFGVVQQPQPQ